MNKLKVHEGPQEYLRIRYEKEAQGVSFRMGALLVAVGMAISSVAMWGKALAALVGLW